jgi:hypothetical protein
MDPSAVPRELARVRAGTRLRLFYVEQGDRYAVSGTLRSVAAGRVTIAPDDGGELTVGVSTVNCFYVPRPPAARASLLGSLRTALRRVPPSVDARPLAAPPEGGPGPSPLPGDERASARPRPAASDGEAPRALEQEPVPVIGR